MALAPFAHKPTLTGELVVLRPYREEDLPHLKEAVDDPEIGRLTGSVNSSDQVEEYPLDKLREWYATRNEQTDRLDLMVVDRATGTCVGEVVLNNWDRGNETCNFRIMLGPSGQGRGLGTEATRLLLGYAFEHLPLHRIELEVYAFNPRARRAYEKAGFVVEGRRRDALLYDGERVDAIVMSVLRPEWLTAHAAG
jgi:RimJ/RimL family protein N-acetyltransferase